MAQSQTDTAKHKKTPERLLGTPAPFLPFQSRNDKNPMFASIACQSISWKLLHFPSPYLALFLEPLDSRSRIAQGMFSTGLWATRTPSWGAGGCFDRLWTLFKLHLLGPKGQATVKSIEIHLLHWKLNLPETISALSGLNSVCCLDKINFLLFWSHTFNISFNRRNVKFFLDLFQWPFCFNKSVLWARCIDTKKLLRYLWARLGIITSTS